VAEQVTEEDLASGLIYPPHGHILDVSLHVAERIAAHIFNTGLARVPKPKDVEELIRARAYRPVYPEVAPTNTGWSWRCPSSPASSG
jgi:malate dehydrogenase (oxaloacetate-decarboxylating)(NADP+)